MTENPLHKRAIALVKAGKTYTEAGAELGLSRCAVAGACHRAGVKVSFDEKRRARWRAKLSKTMKTRWRTLGAAGFGR